LWGHILRTVSIAGAGNAGSSLGAEIRGAALLLLNYEGVRISLGAMGIAAAIVFQLSATDPAKANKRQDP